MSCHSERRIGMSCYAVDPASLAVLCAALAQSKIKVLNTNLLHVGRRGLICERHCQSAH